MSGGYLCILFCQFWSAIILLLLFCFIHRMIAAMLVFELVDIMPNFFQHVLNTVLILYSQFQHIAKYLVLRNALWG